MKTIILLLLLICSLAFSQWQPEVKISNDTNYSATTNNNAWCVAASGDTVHVVWSDGIYGGTFSVINYKRSTDGGLTWGPVMLLAGGPDTPYDPCIYVTGTVVHVVWAESPSFQHDDIYYRRSPDGGGSWEPDIPINTGGESFFPSVTASGPVVIVSWREDIEQGNNEIYARNSTSGGISWGAVTRLTNAPYNSTNSCAAISGLIVNLVWMDERDANGNESEIYLKRSTTGGNSWGADIRLTNASGLSWYPSITALGSTVHLVWEDKRFSNNSADIYYKRSADNGVTWSNDSRISVTGNAGEPSISVFGSNVHVVWKDTPFFNFDIYHRYSVNAGLNWQNTTRLTFDTNYQEKGSVSISNSVVHTVWQDRRFMINNSYNSEVYYRRNPFGNLIFYTCSGTVEYKDNNQPVTRGYAKALRYKYQTAVIETVDSAAILSDGSYTFTGMPRGDTLYIMYYPVGDTLDFVPGYYVDVINWQQATKISPVQNLNNTNGKVERITNQNNPYSISGLAQQNGPGDMVPVPLKDAVIYIQQGSVFKSYGISNSSGQYTASKLAAGTYTLTAYRIGFAPVTQNVTITNSSLQNINLNFGNPIGIKQISSEVPVEFSLLQNYPNPFNPKTVISFQLAVNSFAKLIIYDILGREVVTLVNERLQPGIYEVDLDASSYPSGVYFYKLESGSFIETKKMILIK